MLLSGACLSHARILLLDEPTNGLDPSRRRLFQSLLEQWRGEGRTVVIASHDLDLQPVADVTGYVAHSKIATWDGGGAPAAHVVRLRFADAIDRDRFGEFGAIEVQGNTLVMRQLDVSRLAAVLELAASLGAVDAFVAPSTVANMYYADEATGHARE